MLVSRRLLMTLPIPALALLGRPLRAAADSAPAAQIQSFYGTLLAVMKAAKGQSFDRRYAELAPAVTRTFNLPLMTRIAVGLAWTQIPPAQQQQLDAAFARYTVSTYASRFDGWSGERFEVDPTPVANPSGTIVDTALVKADGERIQLNYLMRQDEGGAWRAIDVFLSGTISELATRRSEFVAVLQSRGADGLVHLLDERIAALRIG
jgi:phospholipid transport system substrate-binding protein